MTPTKSGGIKVKEEEVTTSKGAGKEIAPVTAPNVLSLVRDEFDRLMERFWRPWPMMDLFRGRDFRWGFDVQDEPTAVKVRAEMPGFEPEDIDVRVSDHQLVIQAAVKTETPEQKDQPYTFQQRQYYQAVPLPTAVDVGKIEAVYTNGVLGLTLPKTEQSKGKKVAVKKG